MSYEPRRPHLAALAIVSLFIVILALPMLRGAWLAAPNGDQYSSGYAFDAWETAEWHKTGRIPLWNPMIMGGLPYIAVVTHGDVLYPTALLRAVLPAYVVMNLSFFLHYILAGFFMYLFARRMGASWAGAVTAGVAYQLSGILISLVHPGHDGKLFVSTMLPLALLALVAALRDRRVWGYPLFALAVALCLLSPHVQATYYLLIATGLFALYLTLGEPGAEPLRPRLARLGLAFAAVLLGFAVAAPQILPFIEYIPHSPRAGGYSVGYEGSASFGIPWDHVPEFFIAGFTGDTETYWGSNGLKLHSEYLGLPVIALAILGFGDRRRRLVWWCGGIALLFLLISLGGATPFYHLWWLIMPYVKKTRAPGMVFFVVSCFTALFAAFGVTRLERGEGATHVRSWLIASGVVALLGAVGAFGNLAVSLAPTERVGAAIALRSTIRLSAIIGAVALAAVGVVALGRLKGKISAVVFAFALPLVLGVDLWRDGKHFWQYTGKPDETLYRSDPIVDRLKATPKPYRVLNFPQVYPHNVLMAHEVPQVLGYQGQELRYYDELLGGRNEWRYLLSSVHLWDLLAARFVVFPDSLALPGYHLALGPVSTAAGTRGYLYEADTTPPYARFITAAAKLESDSLVPPTLADPRLPLYERVVLFGPDAPVNPPPLQSMPAASPIHPVVTNWDAGRMDIDLSASPSDSAWVVVAENWYLDWKVTIDGQPGQVLRGDHALLTVPVGPGARHLELRYHSKTFTTGLIIAFLGLLALAAAFVVPPVLERRRVRGA